MSVDLEIGSEGITPDLAIKAARVPPVDAGTYGFVIDDVTVGNDKDGRVRWTVWHKIVDSPKYPNSRLPNNCPLPWINPQTGMWDVSFIYLLTDIMAGTGKAWVGDLRKPDVQEAYKASLKGAVGFMRVTQQPDKEDPSIVYNRVKVLPTKR